MSAQQHARFVNWMLATIMLLVAAGVCGEVVVYGQVQKLQGNVDLILAGRLKFAAAG